MRQQTKVFPSPLRREDLLSLGSEITASLETLAEYGIPSTIGALDLNPSNILARFGQCVFLDWAEGYVGPPFFSFQYFLEHARRSQTQHPQAEGPLVTAYATAWSRFISPAKLNEVFRLMPLLAAFAFAVGSGAWQKRASINLGTARCLRSLTRRMKREADMLREAESKCVS
jgi:hypothetical protein